MARTGSVRTARLRPVMIVIVVVLACVVSASASMAAPDGILFGREGKLFTNFRPIPQWSTLLERYRAEEQRNAGCTAGTGACPYSEWRSMIDRVRGMDRLSQIREVNRFANHWRYITDPINYGQPDYWATPGEFFAKAGDCEDYGIVKFMSLRALGFSNDDLRLVAVQDLNLGVGHAVTVVRLDGRKLLLDNQIQQVIDTSSVRHYRPVFAANENVWWLYK